MSKYDSILEEPINKGHDYKHYIEKFDPLPCKKNQKVVEKVAKPKRMSAIEKWCLGDM